MQQQSIRRLVLVPPHSVFCSISFRCGGLSIERNQKPLAPEITLAVTHHDRQKQVEVKRSSRVNPHEIRLFSGCPYYFTLPIMRIRFNTLTSLIGTSCFIFFIVNHYLHPEAVTADFLPAEKAASVSCPSVLKNAEYKSDPASAGLPVRTFFYHKPVHSRSDLPALSDDKNIWDFP